MSEIDYKALCKEYEKRLGIGEFDPAKAGYLVLVSILTQQNEYLSDFKLKGIISSDDASKKIEYKNASDLWEKLPGLIQKVNALKFELKIEGEQKKENIQQPISPQSIAKSNGQVNV
jgi:hypothetical protein